jgi:Putative Ig domain
MSVTGFDSVTGDFVIRNPWGTAAGQSWDTTFEVSLATLGADGDTITADNIGTNVVAPFLMAQTAAQSWKLGQAVSFALPAGTFVDPQNSTMTYTATLSSGAALPSWLSFNSKTGLFSGTVPNTAAGLSLKVTATDTSGLSASDTFAVTIAAAAAKLTQAVASVVSSAGAVTASLTQVASGSTTTLASPLH